MGLAKYQAGQRDTQSQTDSSSTKTNTSTNNQTNSSQSDQPVQKEDLVVGQGAEAQVGDTITVNYIGRLADGTQFESSYDRDQPATFQLAKGSLIDGWVEGIPGMKEGGKRKLSIPAVKAYGASGQGSIPPNADLTFEIELISVKKAN